MRRPSASFDTESANGGTGGTGGIQYLLQVVQDLSLARNLLAVQDIVRHAARQLTGCDGATFVLLQGGEWFYADEDAVAPLWKGRRFPLDDSLCGWVLQHRCPAVVPDVYADDRIPVDTYRPTFVKSLVMVPIRAAEPIGAIGNYWATQRQPSPDEVRLLQALADCTSVALENVQLYQNLEQRVEERTQQLIQAFDQVHRLSLIDEMTGLYNRRGFKLMAEQALRQAARHGAETSLLFIDLDGLKAVNDQYGHEAGDAMIAAAGAVLRTTFRDSDVMARLGGDEFCVLALDPGFGEHLGARLVRGIDAFNATGAVPWVLSASVGILRCPVGSHGSLDHMLASADALMYEQKRSKAGNRASAPMPL